MTTVPTAPALLSLAVAMALTLSCASAGPASAHASGSAPVAQSANLTLDAHRDLIPPGEIDNSSWHVYLAQLGLATTPGETLQFNFSVNNGTGPAVQFEIHNHVGGYTRYYNATAIAVNDSWKVPDNSSFMVWFINPWNFSVNVSYSFVLYPPPADMSLLVFLFPAVAGVAVGWFLFVRAGRAGAPEGSEGDARDPAEGAGDGGEE